MGLLPSKKNKNAKVMRTMGNATCPSDRSWLRCQWFFFGPKKTASPTKTGGGRCPVFSWRASCEINECFQKLWYPQIIHFNRVWNHYKPSILGYHYIWKHPNESAKSFPRFVKIQWWFSVFFKLVVYWRRDFARLKFLEHHTWRTSPTRSLSEATTPSHSQDEGISMNICVCLCRDHDINYPFGGIKQCKCMVILKDFCLIVHCLGCYYDDPCCGIYCHGNLRVPPQCHPPQEIRPY